MRDSSVMNVDSSQEEAVAEVSSGNEETTLGPNAEGIAEERFRVDRKKMEQMLQCPADSSGDRESAAEDFFQRVMEETGTQISWPSKLKIGAKSKKDPHIKISGKPEAVSGAREMILEVLDAKRNRVTLKMDVSFTDHSHIIGKGGKNIQQVMEETGCHIHFPDSNRTSLTEKSNQVSIAGPLAGVEQARCRIRELLPLVVTFEVPVTGFSQPVLDASLPPIQLIQRSCGINITFRQKMRGAPTTVAVRGTCTQLASFRQGLTMLQEYLMGNNGVSPPVTLSTEISPQHHNFIMGRGGCNIRLLMQQTGTTITFPDPNYQLSPTVPLNGGRPAQLRKSTVTITGLFDNVYLAWQELSGLLPLVLIFDLKEGQDIDAAQITQLMDQLHIQILIKPKLKQNSKSIVIRGHEKDSRLLFEVRRQLLNLDESEVPVCCDNHLLSQSGLMSPLSYGFPQARAWPKDLGKTGASPAECMSNTPFRNQPNFLTSALSMTPFTMATSALMHQPLLPPAAWTLNSTLLQMLLNQQLATAAANRLGSLLQGHTPASLQQLLESALGDLRVQTSDKGSIDSRSSSSPSLSPTTDIPFSSMNGSSGYRGSTCSLTDKDSIGSPHAWGNHNWSPTGVKDAKSSKSSDLGLGSLSSMGSTCSFPSERSGPGSYYSHSSKSGSTDSLLDYKSNSDTNGSAKNYQTFPLDYDHRKLLATKAMQSEVGTEVRVPTSIWSGFGFSKSMPESIIRNKFAEGGIQNGPVHERPSVPKSPSALWNDSNTKASFDILQDRKLPSFQKDENLFSRSNFFDSILPQSSVVMGDEVHDLPHLFSKLGLGKYIDIFQQHDVDLGAFLTMNDKDLQEMGIPYGARRKMLFAISEIAQANMPESARGFHAAPGAERRNSKGSFEQTPPNCIPNCW